MTDGERTTEQTITIHEDLMIETADGYVELIRYDDGFELIVGELPAGSCQQMFLTYNEMVKVLTGAAHLIYQHDQET